MFVDTAPAASPFQEAAASRAKTQLQQLIFISLCYTIALVDFQLPAVRERRDFWLQGLQPQPMESRNEQKSILVHPTPSPQQTDLIFLDETHPRHATKQNIFFLKCMTQWRKEVSAEGKLQMAGMFS